MPNSDRFENTNSKFEAKILEFSSEKRQENRFNVAYSGENHQTYLRSLEAKMREVWKRYISHLDRFGHNKQTKELRKQYFDLFRLHKEHRDWRKLIKAN